MGVGWLGFFVGLWFMPEIIQINYRHCIVKKKISNKVDYINHTCIFYLHRFMVNLAFFYVNYDLDNKSIVFIFYRTKFKLGKNLI